MNTSIDIAPAGKAAATNKASVAQALCIYPLPPLTFTNFTREMDTYVRFMRHLRVAPHSREDIRILCAIGFVADMTRSSDAEVAGTLIEMGLRVPRSALPSDYLMLVDQYAARRDVALSPALADLMLHWTRIGETSVH